MYFIVDLKHTVQVHPYHFTSSLKEHLKHRLYQEVEGTCSGRYGYVVAVLDLKEEPQDDRGRVIPGTGYAEFDVSYQAIVCRVFKGEVVDGTVAMVNKMGFFVNVGPVQCFVSVHLIPGDMQFDANAAQPAFMSEDMIIKKGTLVRIKIIGTRMDVAGIYGIGTIKEDYLGAIAE